MLVVLAIVVAGISVYAFPSSASWEDALSQFDTLSLRSGRVPFDRILRKRPANLFRQQRTVTETKRVSGLEQLTAKYVEEQFEKALDDMPSRAVVGSSSNDFMRIKEYTDIIENRNKKDVLSLREMFWEKIKLIDRFGYPPADNPDDPIEPNEEDKNEFVKELEEALSDVNWSGDVDYENLPESYLYSFSLTPTTSVIDDEAIDIEDPATAELATAFAICAVGKEAYTINSASFDTSSAPWFNATFQGYYSVLNTETLEFEYNQIWPNPITDDGNWPGDIFLPESMELDPYSDHPCAVFAFKYLDIEPGEYNDDEFLDPAYYQFEFRGVRDQVPGDLFAYHLRWGETLYRVGVPSSETLLGTLNIFDSKSEVIVRYYKDDELSINTIDIDSGWGNAGNFELRTFPHTTASIESVEIELVSSYGEDFVLDTNLEGHYYLESDFYDNTNGANYDNENVMLHEGMNTVPLELLMDYGSRSHFNFYMNEVPEEVGNFQLFLRGINGDAFAYEGDCWRYPYPDNEHCASPLESVPANPVYIIEVEESDSFVSFHYNPNPQYWGTYWFDQYDILFEEYGEEGENAWDEYEPQLLYTNISRQGKMPGITVGAFDIEVLGNFDEPMDLVLRRIWYEEKEVEEEIPDGSGGGAGGGESLEEEEPVNNSYLDRIIETTEHTVLPGDVLHIPAINLFKFGTLMGGGKGSYYHGVLIPPDDEGTIVYNDYMQTDLEIFALNVPEDSLLSAKSIRFKIDGFDANYDEDGLYVLAGDDAPIIHDGESLVFPVLSKRFYFGQDLLMAWGTGYMPPIQEVDLSQFDEGDDEFVMNRACVQAQGEVDLFEFTYRHMYKENPPFEDMILQTDQNKLYYNDAIQGEGGAVKWFDDYLTFTLTNPEHLDHGRSSCLSLTIEKPLEQVYGAWFHLMEVTGYNEQGELVNVYTEVVPEPASLEDDPVEGGVIDFLCDFFDEEGVCLY